MNKLGVFDVKPKILASIDLDSQISTELRVVGCTVRKGINQSEVVEIKAQGSWSSSSPDSSAEYPISLHITTYPGCAVVPSIGDNIRITIERA
jgi:hypothetical protein